MATFSESALTLAGFTLAHAVWDVSSAEVGESLTPLAMLEFQGKRRLVRFEGEAEDDPAERARSALYEATAAGQAWAFVRASTWRPRGDAEQVLVVEFWGAGMDAPATVLQPFAPPTPDQPFRLLGRPALATADLIVREDDVRETLDLLEAGIRSHQVAAKYWPAWTGNAE